MKSEKQTIFVGVTNDNELYYIEVEQPNGEDKHFSMCGTTVEAIEEEWAEAEARERLEDGEHWKMAVESGTTTDGLSDFVETVLATDGWESMFDIDYNISPRSFNGNEYYFSFTAGGQHQIKKYTDFKLMFINPTALNLLMEAWDTYHLKNKKVVLPDITQDVEDILQKALAVMTE